MRGCHREEAKGRRDDPTSAPGGLLRGVYPERSRRTRNDNKFGFTLLEIMIAMAILSISLLALYSSVGNSLRISAQSEEMDQATQMARQKMSEVMMSVEDDVARGAFPDEKEEQGTFEKPFDKFKWSYVIKKVEIPVLQPPGGDKPVGSVGDPGSEAKDPNAASGSSTTPGLEGAAANMAQMVTKKISESVRELKLTVSWGDEEDNQEKVVLTTHLSKLR